MTLPLKKKEKKCVDTFCASARWANNFCSRYTVVHNKRQMRIQNSLSVTWEKISDRWTCSCRGLEGDLPRVLWSRLHLWGSEVGFGAWSTEKGLRGTIYNPSIEITRSSNSPEPSKLFSFYRCTSVRFKRQFYAIRAIRIKNNDKNNNNNKRD